MKLGRKIMAFLTVFLMIFGNSFVSTPQQVLACPNNQHAMIYIYKYDATTNAKITGAKFTIQRWNDVGSWNSSGVWVINTPGTKYVDVQTNFAENSYSNSFDPGKFRIIETTAPAGYTINTTPIELTLTAETKSLGVDTFVNFYDNPTLGSIEVTKAITGGSASSSDKFTFKLYKDGSTTVYKSLVITPSVNPKGTFSDLPLGKYKIYEVDADGYTTDANFVVTGSGTTVTIANDTVQKVTCTNAKKLGSISVTKKLAAGQTDSTSTFIFDLIYPDKTVKKSDPIGANQTATFSNLPYGTYTLKEETATGYSTTPVFSGDISGDTITLDCASKSVTCTNSKLYGSITVTKDFSGTAPDSVTNFTFTLWDGSTKLDEKVLAWDPSKSTNSITFDSTGSYKLEYGHTYTIKETDKSGFTRDSRFVAGLDVAITSDNPTPTVNCTNSQLAREVTFEKVVANAASSGDTTVFTLNVYKDGGSTPYTTVKVSAGSPKTISLPFGSYTVSEADTNTTGYQKGTINNSSFTVSADNYNAPITVTANNNRLTRDVTFKKVVANADPSGDTTVFTLNVYKDGGSTPYTTVQVSAAATKTISLPFGSYTVSEADTNTTGYQKGAINNSSFTVSADNYNSTITVTANNTRLTRKVTFLKVVDNATGDSASFTLNVYKKSGSTKTLVGSVTVSANQTAAQRPTMNLPFGDYVVEEAAIAADSPYSFVKIDNSTFTVSADTYCQAISVTAHNSKLYGSITVTKDFTGATPDSVTNFTFTLWDGSTKLDEKVLAWDPSKTTNSITFDSTGSYKLEYGHTYTVKETDKSGFTRDSRFVAGLDVAITSDNPTPTVNCTNSQLAREVTFEKVVANAASSGDTTVFTLNVYKDGSSTPYTTVKVSAGSPKTISLPFGSYTVSEADTNTTGYLKGTINNASFTVGADNYNAPITVTANNTRYTRDVTFKKVVANADPSGDTTVFTLNIYKDGATTPYTTVQVSAAATKTISLPYGSYTVSEADTNTTGYQKGTISNSSFTVTADNYNSTITVTANNTRLTRKVTFQKIVDNLTSDTATFTLNVYKKVSGVKTLVGSVTVSSNQTAAQRPTMDLPFGDYVVEEATIAADSPYSFVKIDNSTFTVDASSYNQAITVIAHNNKLYGSITVTKDFTGATPDSVTNFTFTLWDGSTRLDEKVLAWDPSKTTNSITFDSTGSYKLEYGHTYTVKETDKSGFTRDSRFVAGLDVAISFANPNPTVNCSNTQLAREVTFEKVVANADPSGDKTVFTLNVYKDGGSTPYTTVKVSAGSPKTISLPFGSYTVSEADTNTTGYQKGTINNSSFTVGADNYVTPITVTANNTRLTRDVTFMKVVANADPSGDTTVFTLNVYKDGATTPYTTVQVSAATAKTISLPFGSYTVSEADTNTTGYQKGTINNSSFTVTADNYNSTITVTANNTRLTRKVTFQKIVDNKTSDSAVFTLNVYKKSGSTKTLVGSVTVSSNQTAAQRPTMDLPFGDYVVEEAAIAAGSPYSFASIENGTFTVDADSYNQAVTVIAHNNKLYGSITINKEFAGAAPEVGSKVIFDLFSGESTDPANLIDSKEYTISASGSSGQLVFSGLEYGTYTVKERAISGYSISNGFDTGRKVIIDGSSDNTFVFSCVNSQLLGSISVTKKLLEGQTDSTAKFIFDLTCPDGTVKKSDPIGVGQTASFENLPYGKYTLTEEEATGFAATPLFEGDITGNVVTLDSASKAVTCTNTKLYGDITITKKFTNNDNPAADTAFTFRLWKDGNQVGDAKVLTWSASGANTVSFTGLDFGATYSVTEDTTAGYTTDPQFTGTGYQFTVGSPSGKLSFSADCTNTKQYGSIQITKKFTNNDNPAADAAFTFRLWKGGKQVGDAKVLTWSASGANTVSFTGLDYGATYAVTEDNAAGYDNDSRFTGTGYVFTVGSPDGKLAFTVNCTNTKQSGSIQITKKFTNNDNPAADTAFTFRLWKDGKQVGDAKVLTWSASGANTVSFTGLVFGETYAVTEDAVAGYDTDSRFTGEGYKFTVGSPDGKLAFAVDCTNTKQHGSITITKKFTNNDNPTSDAAFTFRLWKDGKQVGDAKVLTWSASGANTVSFTGLDFGATYYVTEDAADGYIIDSNFAYTGDNSGYAATIGSPDGKLAFAADCTNTRLHGSITVTKKFTNNDNPAVDTTFTFRLWKDGKQVGDAKVLTWSASGDNKVSFSNLDYGATYYVTEDATDGYTTDAQYTGKGYAVKIGDEDGTLAFAIDCTNTKQYGSITLHKAFQGVNTNTDPSNTFDVSIDGVDGTSYHATLHLSADGTAQTLSNLPYNGKFKITEAVKSGYELVSISETATNVNLQSDGTFGINSSYKSIDVVVTNKQLGAVNIKKLVNYTGKMPDFQIRLTGVSEGKTVFDKVISVPANSAAGVNVTDLPYGQYTITEDLTSTPNYENVYITPKDGFTIDNTVKTATIEVRNRAIGSLKVLKLDSRSTDAKQIPVAGVQFEVYYYNEDLQKVFINLNGNDTTDANGELLVTGLEVGITYYAHEIKSVAGYDLVDATRAFVLTTPGQVVTADPFINNAQGKVAVVKYDSTATTTKLAGAVFGIYTTDKITADTEPIARLTTSADDEVLSDNIPFGGSNPTTYYVKEISAPLGYYVNDEVKTVTFTTPGQVIHVSFKDDPIGTLVIKKVDATATTIALAGAEFRLYYDEAMTQPAGDAVTTNADGIATFTNLKPATTYWLMETKAPTDYIQWTAPVNVTELGFIAFGVELPAVHTFTNKHNPPQDLNSGVLIIKKVDALDETKLLAGAEFRLYYDEALTKPVGDAVTTGTDGIARFEKLEPDTTYWLMETKAPTDYIQWTEPVNVTELGFITFDDAEPVVHTFTNQYNPPEPIHTGMMDYNVIIIAGLALLVGLLIVVFTRKRRHTPKHVR